MRAHHEAWIAALEQEIAALTAAQAPMAEARIQGAEVLASSINLGAQSTRDQIVANAAQQGFLGTDSGTEGALMRATLAARADAANKLSDAKLVNTLASEVDAKLAVVEKQLAANNQQMAKYKQLKSLLSDI